MEKKVLIIEDEEDIRDAIAEAVTNAGFTIKTAVNGEEGLKEAFEWQPDLILLDLVMPLVDGHETLRRLRLDDWGKTAKVIVLTAIDKPFDMAMANVSEVEEYIVKGQSTLDEIAEKVKVALS